MDKSRKHLRRSFESWGLPLRPENLWIMSKTLRIKKGVDIRLTGTPSTACADAPQPSVVAVQPTDCPGLIPKLVVKEGASVQAGDALFHDKTCPTVMFASPVSGTVKEVVRGAKRRILAVVVEADGANQSRDFGPWKGGDREALLAHLTASGAFAFFRQRPFDVLANPSDTPRAIYVSGFDSSPLAADPSLSLIHI